MKRSPLGATSTSPFWLNITPVRPCCTVLTKTLSTILRSPDSDSTKNTRSRPPVSPNTPGLTRDTSSRASMRLRYCSATCTDHGAMKNDSAAISSTSGAANTSTGRTHAASDRPELNQITISESR